VLLAFRFYEEATFRRMSRAFKREPSTHGTKQTRSGSLIRICLEAD
jgi:hypothetical protein